MNSKIDSLEQLLDKHILKKEALENRERTSRAKPGFLSTIETKVNFSEMMGNVNHLKRKRDLLRTGMMGMGGILFLTLMSYHDNEVSITRNPILSELYLYLLLIMTVCFAISKSLSLILYNRLLMEENLKSRKSSVLSPKVFLVLLLYLVHPTILLHGVTYDSTAAFPEVHFERSINDMLLIIQVSVLFFEALKQFIFNDTSGDERAKIIIRSAKFNNHVSFFLKYSFKKHPLSITVKFIGFGTLYLSFLLKVAESPPELASQSFLNYWCNCIYLAFVTMLTIGYGDYHPASFLGRFIAVTMGIFGFVFFSLIITAIDTLRNFSRREKITFLHIEEIHLKHQVKSAAAKVVSKLLRCYWHYKHGNKRMYSYYQGEIETQLIEFKEARHQFNEVHNYYKRVQQ